MIRPTWQAPDGQRFEERPRADRALVDLRALDGEQTTIRVLDAPESLLASGWTRQLRLSEQQYLELIAVAFLGSPDALVEMGEEGGDLFTVLLAACERVGVESQDVLDGVFARFGSVRVERDEREDGGAA